MKVKLSDILPCCVAIRSLVIGLAVPEVDASQNRVLDVFVYVEADASSKLVSRLVVTDSVILLLFERCILPLSIYITNNNFITTI